MIPSKNCPAFNDGRLIPEEFPSSQENQNNLDSVANHLQKSLALMIHPQSVTQIPFSINRLPVTIVAPVRNCISLLPTHVAHLRELAKVASELIIVDSDSHDGTPEFVKEHLADLGAIILNHPPGLYQSWNHGIAAATQPYLTVATVGDPLPIDALGQLVGTMENLSADVVLSPPSFLDQHRKPVDKKWPLHELIELCEITGPQRIDPVTWIIFSMIHFPGSMIGSAASNLYRTSFLQRRPFPTDHGHVGDSVWALKFGQTIRWAVDPTVRSFFWLHEEQSHKQRKDIENVYQLRDSAIKFFDGFKPFLWESGVPDHLLTDLAESPNIIAELSILKMRYEEIRNPFWPRFLQPESRRIKKLRRFNRMVPLRKSVRDFITGTQR